MNWKETEQKIDTKAIKEELQKEYEEKLEKEKKELRVKAEKWSEDKANKKAITLFEEEKELSNSMKQFKDQKEQMTWLQEQWALPEWDTAGQIMMKIRIGSQLWLNEYQSITWLAFIKWKLAIWGKVFVGLITSAGYKISFDEWSNEKCTCTITKWEESMTDTYTIEDAKNAGLYPSNAYSPWTKHTKKMLAYKVVNNIASFLCPHVIWWAIIADDAREELKGEKEQNQQPVEITVDNLTSKFETNEK